MIKDLIFYAFSATLLTASLMMILSRNPVRSALFLVLAFFATAGLWILLQAEFLALILIIVYVGAVMTLFLFVVMMIDIDLAELRKGFVKYLPIGALVLAFMVTIMVIVLGKQHGTIFTKAAPVLHGADFSNIKQLGYVLYTDYFYPFELAAVLLLIAIISSITLAHRGPRYRKIQKIAEQVNVKRDERVELVDIPSEPKDKGKS